MKVSDLKLDQPILINGHEYAYKGVQKLRLARLGKVQKVVFQGTSKGAPAQRLYDLPVGNKDLKIHKNGDIELK